MSEETILSTSPKAATYRTDIRGWVSRDGRYWGDGPSAERIARLSGATHVTCEECGEVYRVHDGSGWCGPCQRKRADERFAALPVQEWDGEAPLNLWDTDTYFFDEDAIRDYCEDHCDGEGNFMPLDPASLQLVLSVPTFAHELDVENWTDELPEDGEPPDWLADAVDAFNAAIRAHRDDPLSWMPGKVAVKLTPAG